MAKTRTSHGTRAETARRRTVVEDLIKFGLSDCAILAGTIIPPTSVYGAVRAIVRAEAKRKLPIAETEELLSKKLRR